MAFVIEAGEKKNRSFQLSKIWTREKDPDIKSEGCIRNLVGISSLYVCKEKKS